MALDELTLLINRCRRLKESNEDGENDDKIDKIRDKISDILSSSNEKVLIECSYKREVRMSDFCAQDYHDWIIDQLIDERKSQQEVLADDIRDCLDNYVSWEDITITIKDKNGNELDSFC